MTENKRFKFDSEVGFIDTKKCGGDTISNNEVVELLNELHEENTHIKNTIKEMYETERTALGRSVLRQLLEKIE